MVECPECGKEAGDDKFCRNCGAEIKKTEVCPECNAKLDKDDNFCPECGAKIIDEKSDDGEVADEESDDEKSDDGDVADDEGDDEKSDDGDVADEESDDEKSMDEETESEDEKPQESEPEKEDSKDQLCCPHCNAKLDDNEDFCHECGKPLNFEIQSMEGIKYTINAKKVIVFSLISLLFSAVISLILCALFSMILPAADLYPIAFFISLILVVAIFASFRDFINGGLVGIITGLVLGLLSVKIVELSAGFAFSYVMFSGYQAVVFTIVGTVVGVVSSKYLRGFISNRIDVETLF